MGHELSGTVVKGWATSHRFFGRSERNLFLAPAYTDAPGIEVFEETLMEQG